MEQEFVSSVSQNNYLYQNWDDEFQITIEKSQEEILVECWDYNVEQLANNSHLANALLQLKKIDWTLISMN